MRLFVKIFEVEDPGWYSRVSDFIPEPIVDVEMNCKDLWNMDSHTGEETNTTAQLQTTESLNLTASFLQSSNSGSSKHSVYKDDATSIMHQPEPPNSQNAPRVYENVSFNYGAHDSLNQSGTEMNKYVDSCCAFCDDGGEVLMCDGSCKRCFHPTVKTCLGTSCESLGFVRASQYQNLPVFLCPNCLHKMHQCFICGILGSSDVNSMPEVFQCSVTECGHYYHPKCIASYVHPFDPITAHEFMTNVASAEGFACPAHECRKCGKQESKEQYHLQFAMCRRCPTLYHRQCLPRSIALASSSNGEIDQRAWENLLDGRILMYCMNHKLIPDLKTPERNHLSFPLYKINGTKDKPTQKIMGERVSNSFGRAGMRTRSSSLPNCGD